MVDESNLIHINSIGLEATIIVLLIVLNGLLAMSEMAIVSSRKARLQQLASNGNKGAQTALDLANSPSHFLAAIQIGITLVGVFAGAFGGATVADELAKHLIDFPFIGKYSHPVAFGIVVVSVTLLTLIIGELVPKRLALAKAEAVAALVAKPVRLMSTVALPAVVAINYITEGILKIIGAESQGESPVTEEEVKIMIAQGTEAGVFAKEEETIMRRALQFGDSMVSELMTQRVQLVLLDVNASFEENLHIVLNASHSYFPIYETSPDHLIGIVSVKCVLKCLSHDQNRDLRSCLQEPLFVSESLSTLKLLERFKRTGKHLALVIDEYGSTAGLITQTDVLEAIVGELPDEDDQGSASIVRRTDGSWLIDGMLPIQEFTEFLQMEELKEAIDGDFQTLGGFVMMQLGRIPRASEHFKWRGYRIEVVDMDGHRVDKVLVQELNPKPSQASPSSPTT